MALFSVIVFGVVVWTIAVSEAKQLRFRLKTDYCGRGLRCLLSVWQLRETHYFIVTSSVFFLSSARREMKSQVSWFTSDFRF